MIGVSPQLPTHQLGSSSTRAAITHTNSGRRTHGRTDRVSLVAELRYFDGDHFVLDEYVDAIAEAIIETFSQ